MIIKVRSEEHNFTIPFPNALLLNNVVVTILTKIINKGNDVKISKEHVKILFKDIKKAKKALGNTPLVYVKSSDGDEVIITL